MSRLQITYVQRIVTSSPQQRVGSSLEYVWQFEKVFVRMTKALTHCVLERGHTLQSSALANHCGPRRSPRPITVSVGHPSHIVSEQQISGPFLRIDLAG